MVTMDSGEGDFSFSWPNMQDMRQKPWDLHGRRVRGKGHSFSPTVRLWEIVTVPSYVYRVVL